MVPRGTVHQVLTSEKYVGNNLFNRVSFKLKKKRVVNTPDMWIRAIGAFPTIVDNDIFAAAQAIVAERNRRFSDAEMLERLKWLYEQRGSLSGLIIDKSRTQCS
jgi:Recombinase